MRLVLALGHVCVRSGHLRVVSADHPIDAMDGALAWTRQGVITPILT